MILEVGAVAVLVLVFLALMWLTIRAAEALGLRLVDAERQTPPMTSPQDKPAPQDSVDGPQDGAAPPAAVSAPSSTPVVPPCALSIAALLWWNAARTQRGQAAREPQAPEPTCGATFRTAVLDTVPRPHGGPACFGGRDADAYLMGWDAAVDWIGQGQDAKAPIWGDLAYMTGWYDGVRDVNRARCRQSYLLTA